MSNYDNNMQVIVSKVVSDKPNAPVMRVNLEINGVKYKAGLWRWTRKADNTPVLDKQGNPQLKGKLEVDDFKPNQQAAAGDLGTNVGSNTGPDDFDDDIPF